MFAERHVAARQLAETLIAQQETALTELGLELGSQYQVSHAEQAQLATETANNAVPEQAIGELARLLKVEIPPRNSLDALPSFDNGVTIDKKQLDFKRLFTTGEISTRISPQKQARHVYGSSEYTQYVNTFKNQGRPDLPAYIRQDLKLHVRR